MERGGMERGGEWEMERGGDRETLHFLATLLLYFSAALLLLPHSIHARTDWLRLVHLRLDLLVELL
jgi:hypothetical protein